MFERSENERRVGRKSNFQASQKVRLSRVTFLVGWSDQVARNGESFFLRLQKKIPKILRFRPQSATFCAAFQKVPKSKSNLVRTHFIGTF